MIDVAITAPGEVVINRAAEPAAPRDGEVLVEVNCVTLCGSDYALFDGTYGAPTSYPLRFGHEWSGRVIDTSASTRELSGAMVTGDCSRWCGQCSQCSRDRNQCVAIEKFGLTVDGFSVGIRTVPGCYLYVDEYGLSPQTLAMTEFFSVIVHGLEMVGPISRAKPALIVGGGALGSAAYLLLTAMLGLPDVSIAETDPAKRELLSKVLGGGAQVIDLPQDEAAASARTYRDIGRTARYGTVLECSGSAGGLDTALNHSAFGASVLLYGLKWATVVRSQLVVMKGLRLQGSIGGTGSFRRVLRFFAEHEDLLAPLVTDRQPASRAGAVLADRPGRARQIKSQLTF